MFVDTPVVLASAQVQTLTQQNTLVKSLLRLH